MPLRLTIQFETRGECIKGKNVNNATAGQLQVEKMTFEAMSGLTEDGSDNGIRYFVP